MVSDRGVGYMWTGSFDRYASVLFALIGAAFLLESRNIATSAYGSEVGPNVFPFLLGLILILLSVKLFFDSFKDKANTNIAREKLMIKRFLIILLASILYAAFLETIGYLISTFLFLFISFQTMEKGIWIKNVLVAAVFSLCVYYLFVVVLKGSLPGLPVWFS
jgi:putative tricarboxylic transport membrane protein